MRLLWTVVRIVIVVLSAGVFVLAPFWISGPGGTTIDTSGAVLDAVAFVILVATLWSLWRDRARLA